MSDAASTAPQLVSELKVSAHLMQLDAGVYCIYNTPGAAPPDPKTGLPGTRLSVPPGQQPGAVSISGFLEDGWLGELDAAALVRVSQGPAQLLMTIYQDGASDHEPPRLQVTKLVEGPLSRLQQVIKPPAAVEAAAPAADHVDPATAEIAAHLQVNGDTLGRLGEWMGERGSARWIEGFALSPRQSGVTLSDIEYQAVLGRGWLSPWAEGGQYCGSRGMALPILGLRARLRGKPAETLSLSISATFTDGTAIGPVGPGDACEAESLAPLEAFCISIVPAGAAPAEIVSKPAGPARRAAEPRQPSSKPSRGAADAPNPASTKPAPTNPAPTNPAPAKPARGRRG